jgi:hypothetical protein
MFRLMKLCLSLAAFLVVCWFGATVKLGRQTLFGHLHAIGQTKESQELADGAKQVAEPIVDDVRRHLGRDSKDSAKEEGEKHAEMPALPADAGRPQDDFSSTEKRQLRRLLGRADHHASRE